MDAAAAAEAAGVYPEDTATNTAVTGIFKDLLPAIMGGPFGPRVRKVLGDKRLFVRLWLPRCKGPQRFVVRVIGTTVPELTKGVAVFVAGPKNGKNQRPAMNPVLVKRRHEDPTLWQLTVYDTERYVAKSCTAHHVSMYPCIHVSMYNYVLHLLLQQAQLVHRSSPLRDGGRQGRQHAC